MKKIAILFLVFSSIALFAQKSKLDDLQPREIPDLHDFDPFRHHCSKYDVKRYLRSLASGEISQQKALYDDSGAIQLQTYISTWQPIGPEGGNIIGMAFNPTNNNEIYAATYGIPSHIYKTVNSGETWEMIESIDDWINDIAVDPTNPDIIYAKSSSGIYKSLDGGVNWQNYQFCSGFYGSGEIAINPYNSNILYVGGHYDAGMAVLKSTDGGENWTGIKIKTGTQSGDTNCVAIDPSNPDIIYAGGGYYDQADYDKLYKSSDGGDNWTDITGSIYATPYAIAIDPTNPSKVYVGTDWGILRSSDGGQTWQKNNGYAYAYALAIDPFDPNILYAGYDGSCYKSVDGGVNWTEYSEGIHGECNKVLASSASSTQVFYASNGGIYKSDDSCISWKESHSGILASNIPALAIAPSSPNIIYAEASGNGFFKSNNFGNSWGRLPDFHLCDAIRKIAVNPNDANDLFILTGG